LQNKRKEVSEMKISHSSFLGIYKKTTQVFFDKKLKHIELFEETKIFGIVTKRIDKELYVPEITKDDIGNFKALAGVLLHLHELGLQIVEVKENAGHR
jgi:hypothetical protein